jgi:GNAT superfamily N-acetyltransferase
MPASPGPKAKMATIDIQELRPSSSEIATCALWRVEAFSYLLKANVEEEERSLDQFVRNRGAGVALIAKVDGAMAGTCLLVPQELEACHPVSPWLAGLYVAPVYRLLGVGQTLVRAIEHEARLRGHHCLYLYTASAMGYYQRQGWTEEDRFVWKGASTTMMVRRLRS